MSREAETVSAQEDPVTSSKKFQTLRDRYVGLMTQPVGQLIEIEAWMIMMAALFDEAIAHGIKLVELTHPVSIGFWGAEA